MKMDCRQIEELLMDYLYEELDAAQRGAYKGHLDGCEACAAMLAGFQRTRQTMRMLPELEPPQAVSARLLNLAAERRPAAAVESKRDEREGGFFAWLNGLVRPLVGNPALSAAMALVLVAGVAGALYVRGVKGKGEVMPASPAEAKREQLEERSNTLSFGNAPAAAEAPAAVPPTGGAGSFESGVITGGQGQAAPSQDPSAADDDHDRRGRLASPEEEQGYFGADGDGKARAKRGAAGGEKGNADLDGEADDFGGGRGGGGAGGGLAKQDANKDKNAEAKPGDVTVTGPKNEGGVVGGKKPAPTVTQGPRPDTAKPPAAPPPPPKDAKVQTKSPPPAKQKPPADEPARKESPSPAAGAAAGDGLAEDEEADAVMQDAPGSADRGAEAEKTEQKKAQKPPEPSAKEKEAKKLHGQARAKANTGDCAGALKLRDKIYKVDPTYYDKKVRGDADLSRCDAKAKSKKKSRDDAPAEQREAPAPATNK